MSKKRTIKKLKAKNKKLLSWCYDWKDHDEAREKVSKKFAAYIADLWFYIELQRIKERHAKR